jgi:hypothetical protein
MNMDPDTTFFDRIADGEFDIVIDILAEAVANRRKFVLDQKGLDNKMTFGPGTKVVICGTIKPKYLIGVTGTVSTRPARRAGDIQVDIDPQYYRRTYRYGISMGVPASCLEQIG